ncbi:dienelactone hydrolase family protein [Catenuloplanes atrovinosus]|uniref:Dienelactone hydrolase n=1 Tax=Catenuloplanes atrovinosus TaxID=137266 RepID=A0AAE3YLR7_9ACTN|nr:alpha/beta fold hydrolase [Catenuloplanes atrovinosus]MDR7274847.1 dienelactone hydrolase [Catenuloplanes atrovinosus]
MKRRAFTTLPAAALLPAATPPGTGAGTPPPADAVESPGVVHGNLPAFYERLRADLTYPDAWGHSPIRDFGAWRRHARALVERHLVHPADDRLPFRPRVLDERKTGRGYVRRLVAFDLTRYSRVRAALLTPDRPGPHPAVLLLHDHGARFDIGKEKLVEPWYDEARLASAREWTARLMSGRFAGDELAARGYAVLAVDTLGWGDRGGLVYDQQQALASNLYELGGSPAGLAAREDVRAAAFLASLPQVDRRRVGVIGFSMGGFRAWQVAALSDHVAAAVSACWLTTVADMMVVGNNTLRGQSAFWMLHPGLTRHLDIPDVATIAAPKPLMAFGGELDTLFTPAGVAAAHARLRAVWSAQHAGDRLVTRIYPGKGHVFDADMQEDSFAWLDRALDRTR